MKKATNDGKRGGTLEGKPHKNKQGKDVGGIKAVVTDAGNKPVELEGGEVIINKQASKKHWKLLSKINQSAGNGVPIHKPTDPHDEDPLEEYKGGGNIDFNVNHVPNKWIINYAKKIKEKHPEVWKLGGNIFGNEAFKNLSRVSERGYWLDSEEWMYKKWQSFLARHQHDFRIAGVIAVLKWGGKVNKGWAYMKDLIEAEIKKREGKKDKSKFNNGGNVVTYKQKFNKKYGFELDESHSLAEIAKITKLKLSALQAIYDKGIGAYKTNPQSVRPNVKSKEQWAMARVYSAVMGGKAAKVDANELERGRKYADGGSVGFENELFNELAQHDAPSFKKGGGINQYFDPFTEKSINKIYVSIRIGNESGQKIDDGKRLYAEYEIKSVEEKPFKELKEGTLNGILGVSGSSYNISDWLSHRNCLVLMNVDDFVEINNTEQVLYKDVDYLMKNSLDVFFRLFDRKQKGEQEYEDVLSNIFKHLSKEFELESHTSRNSKALYYYSLITNQYNSMSFLRWLAKQNRVSSPEQLEQLLYQYVTDGSGDSDYNHWQSPSKESFDGTKDEVIIVIQKAILSAASAYRDESEWLMKDAKLNVPNGSQLFFVLGGYHNYQEKYEEMISKYNLRDRYKIYFVRQKDIDKYQQRSWNNKDVRYRKENEILKNMVDNKMLKAFDDVINQILEAYENAVFKAVDDYGFDGNLLENEQITIMYNAYMEKFLDILEQSKKEASITLSKYAFIFAVDNFKQYLREKESELQGQQAEIVDNYGDSPYISSIIRGVFFNALYDVPIDEIAETIKGKIGSDLYRVYQAKDIRFKKGGELSKGTKAEMEHRDTIDKFKKRGVSDRQVAESIAKDHLKEDPKYYTKLMKMESKKSDGGLVNNTKYAMWEGNVADALSDMLDISYNDAQGIIEANDYYVKEAYRKGWSSDATAKGLNKRATMFEDGGNVWRYPSFDMNEAGNFAATIDGKNYEVIYRDDKTQLYDLYQDGKVLKSDKDLFQLFKFDKGGNLEAKVKSKLSKSFALPFELAVYVPSTRGADEVISDAEFRARVKEVEIYLSNLFGGFSKSDIDGGYMSSEKGLITENVAKVTAFGQQQGFEDKLPQLIEKISEWCEKWTQESMGFEFEGDLFYVEKGFKYAGGGNVSKKDKVRRVMHEYKQGTLHIGTSGKIVKDRQQAVAIALSEAGLSKKADGGSITINRETNREEYIKRLLDGVTTLPKANPYAPSKTNEVSFKSVDFTKPIRNDESRAFINTSIYTSEMDYVIGGFAHYKLNNIKVIGNDNPFSVAKLKILVRERIEVMIDDFKDEVSTNIADMELYFDSESMDKDTEAELNNLFKTYLSESVMYTDTERLAEQIMQHQSFNTWMARISQRVLEYQNRLTYKGEVNDTTGLSMNISDIEEITYNSALEQLLEKLSIITQQNHA
jgi:hypothetical protein